MMFRITGILLFLSFSAFASEDTLLISKEKNLELKLSELRNAENDQQKFLLGKEFRDLMAEALNEKGAFTYSFSLLKTVGVIDSPDGEVRIVNWNVELDDQSQKYYGFVMKYDFKKKSVQLTELQDNQFMMPIPKNEILSAEQWYGALYYKIIPIEKGSKKLYTVLGWDGNTSMSNIKLIDVMYFNGTQVKFGSPIFKYADRTEKRVLFEHSEKATMSLRYDPEYKRIIFDHLSPESASLEGFHAFYVPDLSLDAFLLDGSKWTFKEDVIGVNKEEDGNKMTVYVINEKNGKVEPKEIKTKWENPEDSNAPGGGFEHKAVTPEDEMGITEEKRAKKEKKAKDKRDPNQMSTTLGGGKKKKRKN
jgi:hypothetical protein